MDYVQSSCQDAGSIQTSSAWTHNGNLAHDSLIPSSRDPHCAHPAWHLTLGAPVIGVAMGVALYKLTDRIQYITWKKFFHINRSIAGQVIKTLHCIQRRVLIPLRLLKC